MRRSNVIIGIWFLGGCSNGVVSGGSVEQRIAVQEAIDETERASGYTLDISSIILRNVKRGGVYNSVTHEVAIDVSLFEDELRTATRHELCHALDFQLEFDSHEHDEWVFSSDMGYDTVSRSRREAFATTCESGPLVNSSTLSCAGYPLDDELARMNSTVFPLQKTPPEYSVGWTAEVQIPSGEEMSFAGITDSGIVWVLSEHFESRTNIHGTKTHGDPGDLESLIPPSANRRYFGAWIFWDGTRKVGNVEIGIGTRVLVDGIILRQVFTFRDDEIIFTGCVHEQDEWFFWQDQLWLVRQIGNLVKWGPLVQVN